MYLVELRSCSIRVGSKSSDSGLPWRGTRLPVQETQV